MLERATPRPYDEIKKELTEKPKLPAYLPNLFGAENIRRFSSILMDSRAIDIDALWISGFLSDQEMDQYKVILPEFLELRRQIRDLAESIIQFLKKEKKLDYYYRSTFRSDGSLTTAQGYDRLIDTIMGWTSLFIKNDAHYRNELILKFRHTLMERLMLELLLLLDKDPEQEKRKAAFAKLLGIIETTFKTEMHQTFPGLGVIARIHLFHELVSNYRKEWLEFTEKDERTATKEKTDEKWQEILELSEFRKILPYEERKKGRKIRIFGDELPFASFMRGGQVCMIRIIFDEKRTCREPEVSTNGNGETGKAHFPNNGSLELCIDRATGEIFFSSGEFSLVHIFGDEKYMIIKNIVYDMVLGYLKNKEEDIEEAENIPFVAPFVAPVRETREEVQDAVGGEMAETREEDIGMTTIPYEDAVQTEDREPEPAEEKLYTFDFSRLRGLDGERAKSALIRLCGEPVRITGSHHIFQYHNGGPYPVPIHRAELGIGILRKCLRKLGIKPEAFHQAL